METDGSYEQTGIEEYDTQVISPISPFDSKATLRIKRAHQTANPLHLLYIPAAAEEEYIQIPFPQNAQSYWNQTLDYFFVIETLFDELMVPDFLATPEQVAVNSSLSDILRTVLLTAQGTSNSNANRLAPSVEDIENVFALIVLRNRIFPDPSFTPRYTDLIMFPDNLSVQVNAPLSEASINVFSRDEVVLMLLRILDSARQSRGASTYITVDKFYEELLKWKLRADLDVDSVQPIYSLLLQEPYAQSRYQLSRDATSRAGLLQQLKADMKNIPSNNDIAMTYMLYILYQSLLNMGKVENAYELDSVRLREVAGDPNLVNSLRDNALLTLVRGMVGQFTERSYTSIEEILNTMIIWLTQKEDDDSVTSQYFRILDVEAQLNSGIYGSDSKYGITVPAYTEATLSAIPVLNNSLISPPLLKQSEGEHNLCITTTDTSGMGKIPVVREYGVDIFNHALLSYEVPYIEYIREASEEPFIKMFQGYVNSPITDLRLEIAKRSKDLDLNSHYMLIVVWAGDRTKEDPRKPLKKSFRTVIYNLQTNTMLIKTPVEYSGEEESKRSTGSDDVVFSQQAPLPISSKVVVEESPERGIQYFDPIAQTWSSTPKPTTEIISSRVVPTESETTTFTSRVLGPYSPTSTQKRITFYDPDSSNGESKIKDLRFGDSESKRNHLTDGLTGESNRLILNRLETALPLTIPANNVSESMYKAYFDVYGSDFLEMPWLDAVLNDEIFSQYLTYRETDKVATSKSTFLYRNIYDYPDESTRSYETRIRNPRDAEISMKIYTQDAPISRMIRPARLELRPESNADNGEDDVMELYRSPARTHTFGEGIVFVRFSAKAKSRATIELLTVLLPSLLYLHQVTRDDIINDYNSYFLSSPGSSNFYSTSLTIIPPPPPKAKLPSVPTVDTSTASENGEGETEVDTSKPSEVIGESNDSRSSDSRSSDSRSSDSRSSESDEQVDMSLPQYARPALLRSQRPPITLRVVNGKQEARAAQLKRLAPHIFNPKYRYVSSCQKRAKVENGYYERQPIIIDPSEVKARNEEILVTIEDGQEVKRHRQVMRYPKPDYKYLESGLIDWESEANIKSDPGSYDFICPGEKHVYPGIVKSTVNPLVEVPCCFVKDRTGRYTHHTTPTGYQIYFSGEKSTRTEAQQKRTIYKDERPVPDSQLGHLISPLPKVLSVEERDFKRIGVPKSPNSFLHCLLLARQDADYMAATNKMDYVNNLRQGLATLSHLGNLSVHMEALKQELYDVPVDTFTKLLADVQSYLDPGLFYRLFEEYYNCNIYLFGNDPQSANQGTFIFPRHKRMYVRSYRPRDTILIYINQKSKSVAPQCELILDVTAANGERSKMFDPARQIRIFPPSVALHLQENMLRNLQKVFMWSDRTLYRVDPSKSGIIAPGMIEYSSRPEVAANFFSMPDFSEAKYYTRIVNRISQHNRTVLSQMSPNLSGILSSDTGSMVTRSDFMTRVLVANLITSSISSPTPSPLLASLLVILGQILDDDGKMRALVFEDYTRRFVLPIMLPPSQPENLPTYVPEGKNHYPFSFIQQLFGNAIVSLDWDVDPVSGNLGSLKGMWYTMNFPDTPPTFSEEESTNYDTEMLEGVYIELSPDLEPGLREQLTEVHMIGSNNPLLSVGENVSDHGDRLLRKREILLQIFIWIFTHAIRDGYTVERFMAEWVSVGTGQEEDPYDVSGVTSKLPTLDSVEKVIQVAGCMIPGFTDSNERIYLYSPKLADGVRYFLEDYLAQTDGLFDQDPSERIPTGIQGILEQARDFWYQDGVQIFRSYEVRDQWIANREDMDADGLKVRSIIDPELINRKSPYVFMSDIQEDSDLSGDNLEGEPPLLEKSEGEPPFLERSEGEQNINERLMLLQNVEGGTIENAIRVARRWNQDMYNIGYSAEVDEATEKDEKEKEHDQVDFVIYTSLPNGTLVKVEERDMDRSTVQWLAKPKEQGYAYKGTSSTWIYQYSDQENPVYAALLILTY